MEKAYIALVEDVLKNGSRKKNRSGETHTRSVFGRMLRCNLDTDGFPLLTTKRMFWRGVMEELFWFLRGSTDVSQLDGRGVRIWNANTTRAFLDSRGLRDLEEGDAGPIYGFQWRHFGAEYVDRYASYAGMGVDQIARLIRDLRADPESRRHVVSAWNPCDIDKMALPPCHIGMQFWCAPGRTPGACDRTLSASIWCRSQDLFLGTPFNIASYALLTHLIAHVCHMRVGELVMFLGDAHVYEEHVAAAEEQTKRRPNELPMLLVVRDPPPRNAEVAEVVEWLETIRPEDLRLVGYRHHPAIVAEMIA
jgi:thymidylate synthase